MSHYTEVDLKIKSASALLAALAELGFPKERVEVHETPQHLVGYQGDRRADLAHIIIRRRYVGASSNDIGFRREENGEYTAIISDFDRGSRYGVPWQKRLSGLVAAHAAIQLAQSRGQRVQRTLDSRGRIRLAIAAQ